jgi:hypothetical protein
MATTSKIIRVRVYSSYSESEKPIFVHKIKMTKMEFDKAVKDWKVTEFEENDLWRTKTDKGFSWSSGYINELSD